MKLKPIIRISGSILVDNSWNFPGYERVYSLTSIAQAAGNFMGLYQEVL